LWGTSSSARFIKFLYLPTFVPYFKEKFMKTCGLDVHKDSVFCAIYNGKDYSEVKEYETTTPKLRQPGEYLLGEGVSKVAMESTSTYWVPRRGTSYLSRALNLCWSTLFLSSRCPAEKVM
jgi:hypothetical protein